MRMKSEYSLLHEMPSMLTVAEAAKILRIGRSQMYELARTASFPSVRIGRAIRIPTAAMELWMFDQANSVHTVTRG